MPLEFVMACNLKDVKDNKDLIYFKDQYLNTVHFLKTLKLFEHWKTSQASKK